MSQAESKTIDLNRRSFLAAAAALTASAGVQADDDEYGPNAAPVRYPDHRIVTIDDRFKKLTLGNTPVQRLYHSKNMLWAEGPAWNGVGRYLVWSDIPNNVQHRWLEEDGHVSTFRHPSNNSNGNTFDFHGRQISFEHLTRSVVRYEYDGTRTVLANSFNGKSLNGPNDGVVHPNGDLWFSDPGYGALMDYEGRNAKTGSVQPYQKEAIYRIEAGTGKLFQVTDEIFKPNGVCFSPDYTKLYAADTGASHYDNAKEEIRVWDIVDEKRLANGKRFASMDLELNGETVADPHKITKFIAQKVPATFDMSFKAGRFILRDHKDPAQATIDAIGKRKIDDAKGAAERHSRLAAVCREWVKAGTFSSCQYHRKNIVHCYLHASRTGVQVDVVT